MSYTFLFLGETQQGAETTKVQSILAKKFGIDRQQIETIFHNDAKFERTNLNKEVAEAYLLEFAEAGAIGHIIEANEFNENNRPSNSKITRVNKNNINRETERNKQQQKSGAYHCLRWAGLLIVGTMIADDYLQSALIIDRYGLDIGHWPLVLAHIPLLIGCSILAVEKGWSLLLGIMLGCLSLAGLSILLLLPKKGQNDYKLTLGPLCATVVSCGVLIYWLNGFWSQNEQYQDFFAIADSLHHGRNEFPQARQSSLSDYQREQNELLSYVKNVIAAINDDEFRPDDVSKISDRMFFELARYVTWRKYQYFKHKTENVEIPIGLQDDFSKADKHTFRAIFNGISQYTAHSRLNESKNDWFVSVGEQERQTMASKVGDQMSFIDYSVRDNWSEQFRSNRNKETTNDGPPPRINVETLYLIKFKGAELKRYQNHIEYTFVSGPLKGQNIVIGFYVESRKAKFKKTLIYDPKYVVLSHQFPAKYYNNILGVLKGYGF